MQIIFNKISFLTCFSQIPLLRGSRLFILHGKRSYESSGAEKC